MAARGRRSVILEDYKGLKRDEGAIDITTADGQVFTIDPPELWPDESGELAKANDIVAVSRALLGDCYDAFIEAGGTATLIMAIIKDEHGLDAGESPASSSS